MLLMRRETVLDTAMAKLCVNCVHFRAAAKWPYAPGEVVSPLTHTIPDPQSKCAHTHDHLVGDGIEGGSLLKICWQERSIPEPGKDSLKCGPEGRFYEPEPEPVEEKR
jgi:hypothetical protein